VIDVGAYVGLGVLATIVAILRALIPDRRDDD
jgi:hypothetical protein